MRLFQSSSSKSSCICLRASDPQFTCCRKKFFLTSRSARLYGDVGGSDGAFGGVLVLIALESFGGVLPSKAAVGISDSSEFEPTVT